MCEFLCVLSNVWFTWSTPLDRRQTAFRKVGITQGGLNPDEVDRRKFNMWDKPLLSDERVVLVTASEHTPTPLHPDELPEPTKEDGSAYTTAETNAAAYWKAVARMQADNAKLWFSFEQPPTRCQSATPAIRASTFAKEGKGLQPQHGR